MGVNAFPRFIHSVKNLRSTAPEGLACICEQELGFIVQGYEHSQRRAGEISPRTFCLGTFFHLSLCCLKTGPSGSWDTEGPYVVPQCLEEQKDERKLKNSSLKVAPGPAQVLESDTPLVSHMWPRLGWELVLWPQAGLSAPLACAMGLVRPVKARISCASIV